jgi:TetR/AcrR family transcriptional regulator, repressor of fatR-cypB operon
MNVHSGDGMARSEDKREAIFAAALSLFAERGFHGTTVPEIASRAEVGLGTIYRYFESKDVLVNAVYQHWKLAILDAVLVEFPLDRPLKEQFLALWRRWGAFFLAEPAVARFLELHHHAEYLDATSRAIEHRAWDLAGQLIAAARVQGLVKDVPDAVIVALVEGSLVGLVRAQQNGKLELTPEVLEAAGTCVWEAIRA